MSDLDDFARNTVQPHLRPGESIVAIGWMANGHRNWRNQPERFFAVGTTQRLVVLQSRQSLMHGTPKPVCEAMTSYEYVALTSVTVGPFRSMSARLLLESAAGVARFDVPSPSIIGAKSVEGQVDFAHTFLPWIARHASIGALRSPEGVQAAATEWWQRPALEAANEAYQTRAGRATKANRWVRWPLALMTVCLCLIPIGVGLRHSAGEKVRSAETSIAFIQGRVDNHEELTIDPVAKIAEYRGEIDQARGQQTQGLLVSIGGGLGAVAFFVLALRLTRQKRARLIAGAPGTNAGPHASLATT